MVGDMRYCEQHSNRNAYSTRGKLRIKGLAAKVEGREPHYGGLPITHGGELALLEWPHGLNRGGSMDRNIMRSTGAHRTINNGPYRRS